MNRRWRILIWITTIVVFCCCAWVALLFVVNYAPVLEAEEKVRTWGAERGYQMKGYVGDITTEPNEVGACEVRFDFQDYSTDPPKRTVSIHARVHAS